MSYEVIKALEETNAALETKHQDLIDRITLARAELQRFREREPLVRDLLLEVENIGGWVQWERYLLPAARALRSFDLSVKCPSQNDGSADDLTPATPADAAESQGKTPSDAG